MDDPLIHWTLLLLKGLLYLVALPALVLILPLRAITRGAAWWLVALVAVGVVSGVLIGHTPAEVGWGYAFGQLLLGAWLWAFLPLGQLTSALPPDAAARAQAQAAAVDPARLVTFAGQQFLLKPSPGTVLPPPGWWMLYLTLVWRGTAALAAGYLAFASVRDRLRRPAYAVDAAAPDAGELAAAAKRRPDNRRGFSEGLKKRARAGGMPVLRAPWWKGGKAIADTFVLGWDTAGRSVALEGKQREFHVLVAGMTGKGKTVFLCAVVARAWLMGWSVVVIDLKGSATVRRLFHALHSVRRGVARVWTWNGPVSVDLLRGKPEEVAAKVVTIAGTVTGEQHNQESMGYLQWVVKTIDLAGAPRTFPLLQALAAPTILEAQLKALDGEAPKKGEPAAPAAPRPLKTPPAWLYGDEPTQEVRRLRAELATFQARDAVENLRARLRQVTESSAERWLRPAAALPEGQAALDLEAAIRAGEAVLFSVPVERNKLVGEKVGAWLLAEANRVASRLTDTDWGRKSGRRCLLLVDEFSGLQAQGRHVAGPINRIREGGVTLWLFTQSYADLNLLGDDTRDRIIGGTDVQVVFRQATTDDQEKLSRLFGEHEELRREAAVDVLTGEPKGTVKPKRVRVRNVPPDALAALPIGQAFVRVEGDAPRLVLFPNFDGKGEDEWAEDEADDGTPAVARLGPAGEAGEVVDVEVVSAAPAAPSRRPLPAPLSGGEGRDRGAAPSPYTLVE